jgi:hypothetical protein
MDVGTLTLEPAGTSTRRCECCDAESTTIHGFLYDASGETCVYFAGFTENHAAPEVNLLISLGGWHAGGSPEQRHAVPFRLSIVNGRESLEVVAAATSPWNGEQFLGTMMGAEQTSSAMQATAMELAEFATAKDRAQLSAQRATDRHATPMHGGERSLCVPMPVRACVPPV